jgi:hypothetical protein
MSFRQTKLAAGIVNIQTRPAKEEHTKAVDYSDNRLRELGGIPLTAMAQYCGETCIAVIDTETTCETGDNFGKPLIYDIGVTFVKKSNGLPVGKASFIITDTFCNDKLMKAAFFTNRVFTDYPYILNMQMTNLVSFDKMLDMLAELFVKYNVDTFSAYNSNFDKRAFLATAEYCERVNNTDCYRGLVVEFKEGTIDELDLWALSCMTFMNHDDFKHEAMLHHWFTKKLDKFGTSAEIANNYINGSEVGEDHTALSDTAIEAGIYHYCLQQPEFKEVITICLNGHGETWGYVNNCPVAKWVENHYPDQLAEYNRFLTGK